jgi:hypothetical protein
MANSDKHTGNPRLTLASLTSNKRNITTAAARKGQTRPVTPTKACHIQTTQKEDNTSNNDNGHNTFGQTKTQRSSNRTNKSRMQATKNGKPKHNNL